MSGKNKRKRNPRKSEKGSRANRRKASAPGSQLIVLRNGDNGLVSKAYMSRTAWKKISKIVYGNTRKECGALLIGNLFRDRITGATMAFIDDAFTDGEYGGTSDYVFTAASQADCMNYVYRVYGESKHVIGTVHSHGVHDSFFSAVDHTMMTSRCSEEVHLVLSPSHKTYVITFKDMDNCFHEIDLDTTAIGNGFEFERNTNGH